METTQLRLTELIAALSLAADLGNGVPMETTLRCCLLATRLAKVGGADADDISATFYTSLLWAAGCTSTAHEERMRFGDDLAVKSAFAGADFERPADLVRRAAAMDGIRGVGAMLRHGRSHGVDIAAFHCEAASLLASRLGFGEATLAGLGAFFEYWDGRGGPARLRGEAIPFAARAARVAYVAIHSLRVRAEPVAVIRSRAGGELDPGLAANFEAQAVDLLDGIDEESVWSEALEEEPEPRPWAPMSRLDEFAAAFGDFVDLKSVYWLGHSSAVASLAEAAAYATGLRGKEIVQVRHAAHVYRLGRVAVSNRIWDKAGSLSPAEWERVRLYPYFTDRIVSRATVMAETARIASGTQERLDGSGYHRGLPAAAQPIPQRILAAAAAYRAMTESRPQRPARTEGEAAELLRAEAKAGRLGAEAVSSVLEAAGHKRRRSDWPAGLTDREVSVLRAVARGATNRQVAKQLSISEETARNHVKHIYEKIGISTRAGAALFAMQRGLFLDER